MEQNKPSIFSRTGFWLSLFNLIFLIVNIIIIFSASANNTEFPVKSIYKTLISVCFTFCIIGLIVSYIGFKFDKRHEERKLTMPRMGITLSCITSALIGFTPLLISNRTTNQVETPPAVTTTADPHYATRIIVHDNRSITLINSDNVSHSISLDSLRYYLCHTDSVNLEIHVPVHIEYEAIVTLLDTLKTLKIHRFQILTSGDTP